MDIVFFGTSQFSNIVLEKLINFSCKPSLVITVPDKPMGRKQIITPPPVKLLALKHKIPLLQPKTLKNYQLPTTNYQLGIVAAYGKLIPKEILDIPKYGTLNIHPSLLPKYRGPSPLQNTILNDDKETGVSIMLLDEEMDHGPIIKNQKLKIKNQKFTYETLGNKLFNLSADLLIKILPDYTEGKFKPKEQDHSKATYTKIIKKEDGRIDWKKPAEYIERQCRAFTPWPGIFTFINRRRLKISELEYDIKNLSKNIGEILKYDNGFAVQTSSGIIMPKKLQLESKNPQSSKEFLLGHPNIINMKLK